MLSLARRQAVRPLVMVRSCLVELRLAKSEPILYQSTTVLFLK